MLEECIKDNWYYARFDTRSYHCFKEILLNARFGSKCSQTERWTEIRTPMLHPAHWSTSNEHPIHTFLWPNKKIPVLFGLKIAPYLELWFCNGYMAILKLICLLIAGGDINSDRIYWSVLILQRKAISTITGPWWAPIGKAAVGSGVPTATTWLLSIASVLCDWRSWLADLVWPWVCAAKNKYIYKIEEEDLYTKSSSNYSTMRFWVCAARWVCPYIIH